MLFVKKFNLRSLQLSKRFLSTRTLTQQNEEYTEKPEYPEILDISYKSRKEREKIQWHQEIQKLETIEEKSIKINMPKYYGYKTIMFEDNRIPYNSMPLTQHYTRTYFEEIDKLPEFYKRYEKDVESFVKCIKNDIEEAILCATESFHENSKIKSLQLSTQENDKILGAAIVEQINRTILNALSADIDYLSEIDVDIEPRHEAFWFVGGVNPTELLRKVRKGVRWQKKMANDPVDRPVQYIGKPYLALRHRFPLQPFGPQDPINIDDTKTLPIFKYDARVIGYNCNYRHGTNIPGYWPGTTNEFGVLSYQPRDYLLSRNLNYGIEDFKESLHVKGIQSSYAWLLAQAYQQGFTTFNDLTYPLSTQTIITNGKLWSFYLYQLNTTLVHSNHIYDNPNCNYCWGTKELQLYDEIDKNGKCIGLNEDVLKYLINFYINVPIEREYNLKPYLGETIQKVADIEDEKRREFLDRTYKYISSNRPRHREVPEIFMWEKIYKIDNKTRPLEAKRRFFELGVNPFRRRLDEHTPIYIPKCIRPEGPKSKNKWEKTYYP